MTKYESEVKLIHASQDAVYAKLSDLNNLSALRTAVDNPMFAQMVKEKSEGKVTEEQFNQLRSVLASMEFSRDAITAQGSPLGTVTLRIIEREECKCIKFALEGAPVQANLWIQFLPHQQGTLLKCTLGAELNFFMKQMVGGKAKKGVQGLADILAMLPY